MCCPAIWARPSPVATCRGQLVTRTRSSLSFKTNLPPPPPHHLLANILRVYGNSGLTHTSPAGCSCQERSWCFLLSLTQPKTPAPLCLCWDVRSGIPVGGGWEQPLLSSLSWWSSHAPLPQPQVYSCFSSPMGKGWAPLVPPLRRQVSKQVVCCRGWYGIEVGVLGWFPSVHGRQLESLCHSPQGRDGNIWRAAGEH